MPYITITEAQDRAVRILHDATRDIEDRAAAMRELVATAMQDAYNGGFNDGSED